jgi:serpin B
MIRRKGHIRFVLLLVVLLLATFSGAAAQTEGDDTMTLAAGNAAFALDLFHSIYDQDSSNLVFSPYSISQALAMTYAGARGETAAQMEETLSFTLPQPELHQAFSALNADLTERGSAEADPNMGEVARALRIANALWGEQSYPFSQAYMDQAARYYGAGLQLTDFEGAPEAAREAINAWVEEQTEDRIQDIVPQGAITPITRLVLANAIYFYGAWLHPFMATSTTDRDFYLLDGTTIQAPTMALNERLLYAQGDGYQAISLPYAGSGLTFTVILPDEGQFEDFEANLDADTLNSAIGALSSTDVIVYLPKFEFDYGTSVATTLAALGMPDAFNPSAADFTGMVEGEPTDPLFIGDVLHKAFISVDENGTEAAAATVVMMAQATAMQTAVPPLEVHIDHPFVFVIRDEQTGTILFLGRVTDPSA